MLNEMNYSHQSYIFYDLVTSGKCTHGVFVVKEECGHLYVVVKYIFTGCSCLLSPPPQPMVMYRMEEKSCGHQKRL